MLPVAVKETQRHLKHRRFVPRTSLIRQFTGRCHMYFILYYFIFALKRTGQGREAFLATTVDPLELWNT